MSGMDETQAWKPKFGERVENPVAGPANPRRIGMFVRTVRRSGRLNPGTWWQLTDGQGDFWLSNPEHCRSPLDQQFSS